MIRGIVKWPNQLLHVRSVEIFPSDFLGETIQTLIKDMWETMYDAMGVGLSAIQVSEPVRIMVMDIKKTPYVLINPVIREFLAPKALMNEGCLSIPGYIEQIPRNAGVKVAYFDENGLGQDKLFSGLEAQCIQHEVDHMNGIVMPDSLGTVARARLAAKMKKP